MDTGVFYAVLPYFTAICVILYFAHRSLLAEIRANLTEIQANHRATLAEIRANHRTTLAEIRTLAESIHGFDTRLSLVEQDVRRSP